MPALTELTESSSAYGRELRRLRMAAGLSEDELAEKVGVKQPTVSQWETGKQNPRPHRHAKLQQVLGISDDLWWAQATSHTGWTDNSLGDLQLLAA